MCKSVLELENEVERMVGEREFEVSKLIAQFRASYGVQKCLPEFLIVSRSTCVCLCFDVEEERERV